MNRVIMLIMVSFIILIGVSGCTTVKPWQREYLADEIMLFDPDTLEAEWYYHVEEVLEGGRGGFNSAGGGCGCR
jgi:hypothetical protein